MKKILIFISCAFGCVVSTVAQINPAIKWQAALGSPYQDEAFAIQAVPSGGFIVAGYASGNGGNVQGCHGFNDVWILRLTSKGQVKWAKCYGGAGSDIGYSLQNTLDDGFIVAGSTSSRDGDVTDNHGRDDYWVLKLDSIGNIEWENAYGGSNDEIAQSIIQTSDGGYIVSGNSKSDDGNVTGNHGDFDAWIIKLDQNGQIQWEKSYGGQKADGAHSIVQTDDGYIFTGTSFSDDGDVTGHHGTTSTQDYWTVKINNGGLIVWEKSNGGTEYDYPTTIIESINGNFIVAGFTSSSDDDVTKNRGGYDYWIIEIDQNGNLIREKSFGGPGDDLAFSIITTQDNGFIVIGYTNSKKGQVSGLHTSGMNPGTSDIWLTKLDSKLTLLDQICLGGTNDEYGYGVVQTKNGGYVVTGSTQSDDGDVTGFHGSLDPNFPDVWVVRLKPTALDSITQKESITENIITDNEDRVALSQTDLLTIYPTVTNGTFRIKLNLSKYVDAPLTIEVLNADGLIIYKRKFSTSGKDFEVPFQLDAALLRGLYLVKANLGDKDYCGKVLLQ